MISEQIERLRQYARFSRTTNPSWSAEMLRAADMIEELAAKLHRANMERSIAFYNDKWIPVEELLPEESDEYLLLSFENADFLCIGDYRTDDDGNGAFYEGDDEKTLVQYDLYVNAWRRLPKRYRKEK